MQREDKKYESLIDAETKQKNHTKTENQITIHEREKVNMILKENISPDHKSTIQEMKAIDCDVGTCPAAGNDIMIVKEKAKRKKKKNMTLFFNYNYNNNDFVVL